MINSNSSKSFIAGDLAHVPAAAMAYEFAFHSSPVLADLDADGENLAILSLVRVSMPCIAARLARCGRGSGSFEWHPSASHETAIVDARDMDAWMFEHRAARAIIDRMGVGNVNGCAFIEEVGAKLVAKDDCEAYYLTTSALQ